MSPLVELLTTLSLEELERELSPPQATANAMLKQVSTDKQNIVAFLKSFI
jgi:hypothetical protein